MQICSTLLNTPRVGFNRPPVGPSGISWRYHRDVIILGIALTAAAIGFTGSAHAADSYYRWKDERGNLVVSDRPPEASIEYEVFSTGSNRFRRVSPGEGAVPPETTSRPGNRFETSESDDDDPMETVAVEVLPEKNPEICERARQNLQTLESAARIRVRDESGELRYLTEDEKDVQRQNALDNIEVHCDE